METGKAIYYLLKDSSDVGAICADRIYPEIAQQDADVPFVAYTISDTTPSGTKTGSSDLDTARVELYIVSDDYAEAMNLGIAVRTALDRQGGDIGPAGGTVAVQSIDFDTSDIDFDQEQGVYITEHTYNMRVQRTGQAGSHTVTPNNAISVSDNDSSGAVTNLVFSDNTVDISGNTATIASGGGGGSLTVQETDAANSDTANTLEFPEGSVTHDSSDKATISMLQGVITEYGADAGLTDSMFPNGLFGDIDQSGTVGTGDLLAVLGNFGATASPSASELTQSLARAQSQMSDGNNAFFSNSRNSSAQASVTALTNAGHTVEYFEGINSAQGRGFISNYLADTVADSTVRRTMYISATPFPTALSQMQQYPLGPYDNTAQSTIQAIVDAYINSITANGSVLIVRTVIGSTPDKLLDTYTGAAAAYSVRLLDKDYSGSCMRIRRDSDDSETDIGFDSSGDVDTSAISTFAGSANAYCVTWYDQSGNTNNATQSTGGSQPQIYNGSAVITENGKPILRAVGGTTTLSVTSTVPGPIYVFSVVQVLQQSLFLSGGASNWIMPASSGSGSTANNSVSTISATYKNGNSYTLSTWNNNYTAFNNQSLFTVDTSIALANIGFPASSAFAMYSLQELVVYDADQSSNRSGIETDINNYYSIY